MKSPFHWRNSFSSFIHFPSVVFTLLFFPSIKNRRQAKFLLSKTYRHADAHLILCSLSSVRLEKNTAHCLHQRLCKLCACIQEKKYSFKKCTSALYRFVLNMARSTRFFSVRIYIECGCCFFWKIKLVLRWRVAHLESSINF